MTIYALSLAFPSNFSQSGKIYIVSRVLGVFCTEYQLSHADILHADKLHIRRQSSRQNSTWLRGCNIVLGAPSSQTTKIYTTMAEKGNFCFPEPNSNVLASCFLSFILRLFIWWYQIESSTDIARLNSGATMMTKICFWWTCFLRFRIWFQQLCKQL